MPISPNDCVTRFVKKEKDCRNGIIKPGVFKPGRCESEISVFIISDLQKDQIWQLGRNEVSESIVGRADLTVSCIYEKGFEMQNGRNRHFGIIPVPKLPFPDDPTDYRNLSAQKTRKEIALKLIAISRLHKI